MLSSREVFLRGFDESRMDTFYIILCKTVTNTPKMGTLINSTWLTGDILPWLGFSVTYPEGKKEFAGTEWSNRCQCPVKFFKLLWIKHHRNHVLRSWEDTQTHLLGMKICRIQGILAAPLCCLICAWTQSEKSDLLQCRKPMWHHRKKKSGITLEPKYLDSGLEPAFTLNALNVSIFSCNCKCFTWVYLDKNHLQETKHKKRGWGLFTF